MSPESVAPTPAPVLRADRVRLCFLLAPKEGMSVEEFRDHWFNQHGKIFSSLTIVKKNVLKYEQVSSEQLQFSICILDGASRHLPD